jgi:hypothetical protein
MEVGDDLHYNIAQAPSTSNESDNFFSQSGVILFRASNKSDFVSANQVSYCYDVVDLSTSRHSAV